MIRKSLFELGRAAARPAAARRPAPYRLALSLMLAPFLVGALALVLAPGLLTAALALARYDTLSPPAWVGLDNLRAALADPIARQAAWNSLLFVALSAPLRVLAALGLALLLNRPGRAFGAYRTAVYLPTVVPDAAYALVWLWLLNPLHGPLNLALGALGLPTPAWLADRRTALPALALMSLFQIGEGLAVMLAALQAVPREYHQAAAIDGAGPLQAFALITMPLIGPWLLLLFVRDLILAAHGTFAPALLMTGGGPYYATLFLPLLIYQEAFDRLRLGSAAALLLVLLALIGLLIRLALLAGRGVYADEA